MFLAVDLRLKLQLELMDFAGFDRVTETNLGLLAVYLLLVLLLLHLEVLHAI